MRYLQLSLLETHTRVVLAHYIQYGVGETTNFSSWGLGLTDPIKANPYRLPAMIFINLLSPEDPGHVQLPFQSRLVAGVLQELVVHPLHKFIITHCREKDPEYFLGIFSFVL